MLSKMIDKLIFGFALLTALQFPLFAEHYHQFLSGYYKATQQQIDRYEEIVQQYSYDTLQEMIDHHLQNNVASVRSDAQTKLEVLNEYEMLLEGMSIFQYGNLAQKSIYMFYTGSTQALASTFENFKPGVPLSVEGLTIGVIFGLFINLLITAPFMLIAKMFKKKPKNVF